ncbi:MAG: helix-turn-helix domain-containing protein [Verrucomicrobiae bacterium]|nr:helix-turn-helix domain-containing protein [Verrucomicrobiae bacterium]
MNSSVKLFLREFIPRTMACHFARIEINASRPKNRNFPHSHDYHEIFWIEDGDGWHLINGEKFRLQTGSCFFIKPADVHTFDVDPEEKFHLVNISFSPKTWETFRIRYLASRTVPFENSPSVHQYHLSPTQLEELKKNVYEMAAGRGTFACLDRFLLNFFYLLESASSVGNESSSLPDWLKKACREISQPQHFRKGSQAFVHLAGRSAEHVARELKRLLGKTPTGLANEARMNHAAILLGQSQEKILNIVLECGFRNVGHFYSLFRKQFGISPRRYRLLQQRIVQP